MLTSGWGREYKGDIYLVHNNPIHSDTTDPLAQTDLQIVLMWRCEYHKAKYRFMLMSCSLSPRPQCLIGTTETSRNTPVLVQQRPTAPSTRSLLRLRSPDMIHSMLRSIRLWSQSRQFQDQKLNRHFESDIPSSNYTCLDLSSVSR